MQTLSNRAKSTKARIEESSNRLFKGIIKPVAYKRIDIKKDDAISR